MDTCQISTDLAYILFCYLSFRRGTVLHQCLKWEECVKVSRHRLPIPSVVGHCTRCPITASDSTPATQYVPCGIQLLISLRSTVPCCIVNHEHTPNLPGTKLIALLVVNPASWAIDWDRRRILLSSDYIEHRPWNTHLSSGQHTTIVLTHWLTYFLAVDVIVVTVTSKTFINEDFRYETKVDHR